MTVFTVLALVQRSVGLLLLPFVTRAMSPDDYGAASLITVAGTVLGAGMGSPVEAAVFRAASRLQHEPGQIGMLAASRLWLLVIGPSACLLVGGALLALPADILQVPSALWGIEIIAAGLGLYGSSYVQSRLRAEHRFSPLVLFTLTSIVVSLASKIAFVLALPWGVWGWVLSDLVAGAASLLLAFIIAPRTMRVRRARRDDLRSLVSFSLPLLPHSLAFWGISFVNRPILAVLLPLSDVGYLSIAQNVVNVGVLIVAEINRAVTPEYARTALPGPTFHLARVMRLQWIIGTATTLLMILMGRPFVDWILGSGYDTVASAIGLMAAVPLLWTAYGMALNFPTQTMGNTRWNWIASTLGLIVVIVGSFSLVPVLGLSGGPISVTISWIAMAGAAFFIVRLVRAEVDWKRAGLTPALIVLSTACVATGALANQPSMSSSTVIALYVVAVASAVSSMVIQLRARARTRS
ncbi:O-antigen/teichoic acid export membrane protein [Microbacterium laevaniformans]|nr:lipopolysaccharide biosynthesis protein [Microbacterium laevaniformans]MBM7751589.1 O-antigen/teichoic acid export membrane protein [Microbacterium laevaniformans]